MAPRVALAQDVVPPAIDTFVTAHARDAGDTLPAPPRVVGQVDAPPITLFVSGKHVGVLAGSRIGWLRLAATQRGIGRLADTVIGPSWFDLGPDDSALARTAVTMTVAPTDSAALRAWRIVVAMSPVTPLTTLLALLRVDSTLGPAVAMSPRLLRATSPWPSLMALAGADDGVAAVVITNPEAPNHPRDWAMLAERRPGVFQDAMRVVLSNLPALVASGPIDDRLAVHLATAVWRSPDSTRRAVAALPAVSRSATARTILAIPADTMRTAPFLVDTVRLGRLIDRIEGDTNREGFFPPALGTALPYAPDVRANHQLLRRMASLNGHVAGERWRAARLSAMGTLVWVSNAPEDIEFVARQLADSSCWHHDLSHAPRYFVGGGGVMLPNMLLRTPRDTLMALRAPVRSQEGMLASRLVDNPSIWRNRPALELLAALPIEEFGGVPLRAKHALHVLDLHP